MNLYSYIVRRDYGFAPNPFYGVCTLATCKPRIRQAAKIGDIITGFGSGAQGSLYKHKLIYAMIISQKITFDEYWNDVHYSKKIPVLNGSIKQFYGDNIYHRDLKTGGYIQEPSHHSYADGSTNYYNFRHDTTCQFVLIAKEFWYYGEKAIPVSEEYHQLYEIRRNHRTITDELLINDFLAFMRGQSTSGYIGDPCKFSNNCERYDGRT